MDHHQERKRGTIAGVSRSRSSKSRRRNSKSNSGHFRRKEAKEREENAKESRGDAESRSADKLFYKGILNLVESRERRIEEQKMDLRAIGRMNERLREDLRAAKKTWTEESVKERNCYMRKTTKMATTLEKAKARDSKMENREERIAMICSNLQQLRELHCTIEKIERTVERNQKRASRLLKKAEQKAEHDRESQRLEKTHNSPKSLET